MKRSGPRTESIIITVIIFILNMQLFHMSTNTALVVPFLLKSEDPEPIRKGGIGV